MLAIEYKDGMKLELWVWDTGALEGFAIYLNGELLDEEAMLGMKYPIDKPTATEAIVVHFGGADGGATKIVDTANANVVLAHQDSGAKHSYLVTM